MIPRPRRPVTMQISFTPSDLQEARDLLPHQLRTWGNQVDEILCMVDVPPARAGHNGSKGSVEAMGEFLEAQRGSFPHLTWRLVDYSDEAVSQVRDKFYGGRKVPLHDYRDRPIYAYLHVFLAARHDLVFHIDSDMMFGGMSQTWMAEAVELLAGRPDLLAVKPFPGPPRPDGRLLSQRYRPIPEQHSSRAYRLPNLTYRVFLLDRRTLQERLAPLRREWPPWRPALRTLLVRRRRPHAIVEQVIDGAMRRKRQYRLDFLGEGCGMWSVHPRERSDRYRRALPAIIRLIEAGEVHETQRGEYDLTEGMLTKAEGVAAD